MIIDCISDLHGFFPQLEGGDLLIIAGDLTSNDQYNQYDNFFKWLREKEYKKKIIISGNHDVHLNNFMHDFDVKKICDYLCDSGTEFEDLKIWGSPWSLKFSKINPFCQQFTTSEIEIKEKLEIIPLDIDILITHIPPYGIFDEIKENEESILYSGSKNLRKLVISNRFKNLKLHVFGHIHEHGGKILGTELKKFINASIVNEKYQHTNKPVRVIL